MTPFYLKNEDADNIEFYTKYYQKEKKDDIKLTTEDFERWQVIDPNKYKKEDLKRKVRSFITKYNMQEFMSKISKLKINKFPMVLKHSII